MKREILISSTSREIRVAIIEDDQLVELLVDRPEARRMVGDIFLGRVERFTHDPARPPLVFHAGRYRQLARD